VPAVTVRPFNTFGPRQSARAVIPTIITQCLTSDTVRLGSLYPTRDLNYVSNTVDGFVKAAEAPNALGHTINLGSGREISIGGLAELIVSKLGRPVRITSDDQRVRPSGSEVGQLLADNTLAQQVLQWTPAVSLEDGLDETIAWIKDNLGQYRPDVYNI